MSRARIKTSSSENHPIIIQRHNKSKCMISCFSRVRKVRCDEVKRESGTGAKYKTSGSMAKNKTARNRKWLGEQNKCSLSIKFFFICYISFFRRQEKTCRPHYNRFLEQCTTENCCPKQTEQDLLCSHPTPFVDNSSHHLNISGFFSVFSMRRNCYHSCEEVNDLQIFSQLKADILYFWTLGTESCLHLYTVLIPPVLSVGTQSLI